MPIHSQIKLDSRIQTLPKDPNLYEDIKCSDAWNECKNYMIYKKETDASFQPSNKELCITH